jgi:hypothetical protein
MGGVGWLANRAENIAPVARHLEPPPVRRDAERIEILDRSFGGAAEADADTRAWAGGSMAGGMFGSSAEFRGHRTPGAAQFPQLRKPRMVPPIETTMGGTRRPTAPSRNMGISSIILR